MADKEQIIIDGVDVSECLFYQSNFEEDYDVQIKHFCSNWHNSCESVNNSNCYYKQLARKTQELYFARNEIHSKTEYIQEQRDIIDQLKQECESLKQEIEILQNNFNTATRDCNDEIEILKQECEELKEQLIQKDEINTFFNTPIEGWSSNPCDICESKNNYGQLKHECEELEKKLNTSEEWRIKAENLNEKQDLENTRYRKALEEIDKVINNIFDRCLGHKTDGCTPVHNVCEELIKILDIISKAKERENEQFSMSAMRND